jgi:signal transduction histidine kinase
MDPALPRREALRIFRLILVVQLTFLALTSLAVLGVRGSIHWGGVLRAIPTLLLALLFLPPWLERVLGRYFLALGLALHVLFSSLETAYVFGTWPPSRLSGLGLPPQVAQQLAESAPIEPFFFLLIPLVLMAWGYGRRGALLGSSLAAVLHLGIGFWVTRGNDSLLLFAASALARVALLFIVPLLVSVLAERERQRHTELQAAHQRLRRHTATVEQLATSRERNRLARELHDTLAHSLSALTVQLEALRSLQAHDPEAARVAVDRLAALSRRGLEESRQAIQALRTDMVETLGLEGALRDMIQDFRARTGLAADLVLAGQECDLTVEEAQALYRIADEALTNVERHAAAGSVNVHLACGLDRVDLVIRDDGIGFDLSTVDPERYGLTGMAERAALVGATLEVHSRPGSGAAVWCTLER